MIQKNFNSLCITVEDCIYQRNITLLHYIRIGLMRFVNISKKIFILINIKTLDINCFEYLENLFLTIEEFIYKKRQFLSFFM